MKRRIHMLASSLMVIMMMLTACSSASTPKIEKYADTIIYSDMYTAVPDAPQAQAMAIKNGKILAVGSRKEMAEYIGPDTAQEDYTDSFLMPGMIDGHTHLYIKEESNAGDFVLTEYKSAKEYLAVIAEAVEARPNAQMYRGFGWLDSMFVGGTPTAEMLDAVCNTVPIYIQSEDCHSCWVNTRMMELCGITADLENPLGGVIERNE